MKSVRIVWLLAGVLFVQDSRAQDYTRWGLPEGALARLGKGIMGEVAWSPDGTRMAVPGPIGTWLYDAATGEEKALIEGASQWLSPDGQTLASGSRDGTMRLWNVSTGLELATLEGHTNTVTSVSFSPDGQTLASVSYKTIRLWEVATGQEIATLEGHTDGVTSVSFSPDGQTLASGSENGRTRLWDVATGQEKDVLVGHTDRVLSVSFSPDGQTLATRGWD